MTLLGAAVVLTVAFAVGSATPAHADDPTVGSGCDSGQLNLTTTSSAGEGLRCLADNNGYIWQRDDGTTPSQGDAERTARDACRQLRHGTAECESLLDRVPGR